MTDTKHGWVTPRADGARARCGGPGVCATCDTEAMHEKMLTGLFGASVEAETAPVAPKITPIPAGWKPIESAPKDGTPVLLFARHVDAEASTRVVGWFNADYGWIAQSYIGQPVARLIPSQWAELLPFPGTPAPSAPGDAQDEQVRHKMNADLCAFYMRWEADGDYLRCRKCRRPQIASYAEKGFPHAAGCKAVGNVEQRPWLALIELMRPLIGYAAPAAGDAQDDETRWTLRWIMREANAAKETCGTDPESPAAIRNAKLAAIATAAAQALGLVRGPSYAEPAGGDALDAARWRWVLSHAENVGFDYRSGRFTTLTVAGRQRESLVAFVDAALAAQVPQQGEA